MTSHRAVCRPNRRLPSAADRRRRAVLVDLLFRLGVMQCDHKIMWWWPVRHDVRKQV